MKREEEKPPLSCQATQTCSRMDNMIKSEMKTYDILTPFGGEAIASRILSLATTGKFAHHLMIK